MYLKYSSRAIYGATDLEIKILISHKRREKDDGEKYLLLNNQNRSCNVVLTWNEKLNIDVIFDLTH